ncbi:general secretion pathway protein GspK [Dyella tabacisoli]|uniref:General secretion pathway protein GspK n=1 Tax=Dyella tabacisoli TaxID=2282381 RepID=A0A369UKU1_9GAMM|nr:type II secretion system protein GspK [Dyella tabacisoli]RDD80715.1 general secretion pathway protein GspK [Dyella tabacisoli]
MKTRPSIHAARRQRGVALLVVLWACTLLAILLGGYAMLARTEAMQARYQFAQTQAHYAAEAGVMRAIYGLQDTQQQNRWVPDGRVYPFKYEEADVKVTIIDEGGKVDLNAANPNVLQGLFHAAGLPDAQAQELAGRVVEWRSFGLGPRGAGQQDAAYATAGRDYGPRKGPFASIEELQLVLGMNQALYRTVAPVVTLWSGRDSPDVATAPLLALAAIPGMDPNQANALYAARQAKQGTPALVGFQGVTHSIRSEATLADGTVAVLRTTVRLQGIRPGATPYAVLRWQEGDGE